MKFYDVLLMKKIQTARIDCGPIRARSRAPRRRNGAA